MKSFAKLLSLTYFKKHYLNNYDVISSVFDSLQKHYQLMQVMAHSHQYMDTRIMTKFPTIVLTVLVEEMIRFQRFKHN